MQIAHFDYETIPNGFLSICVKINFRDPKHINNVISEHFILSKFLNKCRFAAPCSTNN